MEQVGQQVERHTPAGRAVRQDPDRKGFGLEPHPARDGCAGLDREAGLRDHLADVIEIAKCLGTAVDHGALVCKLSMIRFGLPSRMTTSSIGRGTRRGVATPLRMILDDCDNRSSIRRTSSDP